MNTKPGKISISDLHKIISLSEKLLLENSISEICDLVISLVKDEFNCLAEIELHDQDITNIDKYNILEDDYSGIDTGDYEVSLDLVSGDMSLGRLHIIKPDFKLTNYLLDILNEIAHLTAAAIDRCINDTRIKNSISSEQQRYQIDDSTYELAVLLAPDVKFSDVLERVLKLFEKKLEYEVASLWMPEESEEDMGLAQNITHFIMESVHIDHASSILNPYEWHNKIIEQIHTDEFRMQSNSWVNLDLISNTPVIRQADAPLDPLGNLLGFPPDYSAIATPLIIANKVIGFLLLQHQSSGVYNRDSLFICETYAKFIAVTIENIRLYEAAHDQAWFSTVLLQISEAIQSIISLEDLLNTIVRILPDLVGISGCGIMLWENDIEAFIPTASFGFTFEQAEFFDQWIIPEGEITTFDQLRVEKKPVIYDSEAMPLNLFDGYIIVLFPMVVQSEIRGVFVVLDDDYGDDQPVGTSLNIAKINLIQGIVHQTAIAIENIRLFKAQEDEAYISVALLQVAQTIVNFTDLNDVLSSITRLTPILIGAKRIVIYLWDDIPERFYLSQTYGIMQKELVDLVKIVYPDDFPLLSVLRFNNCVVAHDILSDTDSPLSMWQSITLEQIKKIAITPMDEMDSEYTSEDKNILLTRNPILYGLPLSIKGNLMGVMLIQEIKHPKYTPAYPARQKRLEILTGITQQIAFAIQNDKLQKELLTQEVIKSELKLARDIQKEFLPKEIPFLDNWDVDVRWHPARQVGGDFYDIFKLSYNQLGIVIADVADKGLPAALYMVLVRTLIRAAVKQGNIPSEVLKNVNNLIIPDSKHGMFVTVIYGVLNIDSGIFTYANSGHNPPLVYSAKTNRLKALMPTGMAIGIEENINISNKSVNTYPGDVLVLYTDGVTESFSPDDVMFGVSRLKKAIKKGNVTSAKHLLDDIETSILKFLDGMSPSDDITLVSLLRRN